MKKSIISTLPILISIILLSSCSGRSEHELAQLFDSLPPSVTMPYENPQYFVNAVPDQLPFSFIAPPNSDLLGAVEDGGHQSGTVLLKSDQSTNEILDYYTNLLTEAEFSNARESRSYRVFFPPAGDGAAFCGEQGAAVFLEIFENDAGSKDVRLSYTTDTNVIERTTCGQPILAIEDFPFPYLEAPANASVIGGGGGGGGGGKDTRQGTMGYMAQTVIDSEDSLEIVYQHYADLLAAEGWVLLSQSPAKNSLESSWDFGFYETRSWLARLTASPGDTPNQYIISLRAISP
jgi:hypothetical protein